jgi:hypothetical protein
LNSHDRSNPGAQLTVLLPSMVTSYLNTAAPPSFRG